MTRIFFKAALVVLHLSVLLSAETITLQQDVDNYTGCEDAWATWRNPVWNETPHGDGEALGVCWQRYLPS